VKTTRRGTTNTNARGSSLDRMRRKRWLVKAYEADIGPGFARCYRCGMILAESAITVDRIIPGCQGGRYVRSNIRPACSRCNSETGGAVRS
jgi:5-methylcytosine-specific restriction endonuclease McrA